MAVLTWSTENPSSFQTKFRATPKREREGEGERETETNNQKNTQNLERKVVIQSEYENRLLRSLGGREKKNERMVNARNCIFCSILERLRGFNRNQLKEKKILLAYN